uniref:NfeD-like C-terminal domain-containing protein n=1 Tax=Schlesneria paludicola TaxID=360056 RepID=A0A7C2P4E5_9PLAN
MAIWLLLAGLGVLVLEVFVPSGGALAIITTITLCLSLACAYAAWYEQYPALWWGFCGLVVLLIPSTLIGAFVVLPRTKIGRKALLVAPDAEDLEPYTEEAARLARLVGQFGTTLTLMNPGGMVEVAGHRLHAFSEGMIIEPGESVEIVEIRGTRVLVRPAEPPASSADGGDQSSSTLDFDLPEE